jgi:Fe-S cluster assembly iron-binding protein IscA
MRVSDILTILPEAEGLFAQYGLHCNGCSIAGAETLADATNMHSMKEEEINDLLTDLHILLARRPARLQTITVTADAATALGNILATEGKAGWVLHVGVDEAGGFNMEIVKKALPDDHLFTQSDVTVSASSLTLATIGGSTIDYREGRFKLDLPAVAPAGAKAGCACENGPHSAEATRGRGMCACN